jgi:copper resistance protein B
VRRLLIVAALPLALAGPALAQEMDPHAGHHMPAQAAPTDPHAGHAMPAEAVAGGDTSPPIPADHDADRYFSPAVMAAARRHLAHEHGAMSWSKVLVEKLELRPSGGADGYAWEGRAEFGGDIERLVIKSRGDGARELDRAELDVLYARSVTPYFNLEAGVRQDLEPRSRTYLTLGFGGVAPYGFDLDTALFLSDRGDLTARAEAAHDFRLTQRLILEPRAEANFAAQNDPAQRIGSGLSSLELGLRLRYAVTPQIAPYVGVNFERRFGETARLARAAGQDRQDTRFVIGLRTWF